MTEGTILTDLLQRAASGDVEAGEEAASFTYGELRRIAGFMMAGERSNHTLQPTALVHEIYIRLLGNPQLHFENRRHFLAIASREMRRVLVDHSRQRLAAKREGRGVRLDHAAHVAAASEPHVAEISEAIDRLAKVAPRAAQIVELRFFLGLTSEEISEALGVTCRTVEREWQSSKAWLRAQFVSPQPRRSITNKGEVEDSSRLLPGDYINGRYLIERELGAGTFGRVYLATDENATGRKIRVAVKIFGDAR